MTIGHALRKGRTVLLRACDTPDLDTQWLLLFILGIETEEVGWLFAHGDYVLTEKEEHLFLAALDERFSGKPLAHILGFWEFYGRRFMVNKHVLVPRPSTEFLVDDALRIIDRLYRRLGRPLLIADIGTGSGCIAITLLLERDTIDRVYATDISPRALFVAEHNAQLYGVTGRSVFLAGDMLEPLADHPVDMVVSNPPYVPSRDIARAPLNSATAGLAFEPSEALDGGPDGLTYVNTLARCGKPAVIETSGGRSAVLF